MAGVVFGSLFVSWPSDFPKIGLPSMMSNGYNQSDIITDNESNVVRKAG